MYVFACGDYLYEQYARVLLDEIAMDYYPRDLLTSGLSTNSEIYIVHIGSVANIGRLGLKRVSYPHSWPWVADNSILLLYIIW